VNYDNELLDEFVVESREHLDTIEPDLLDMEKDGANASQEVLNRVFRAIHSIKGAAGFFAFEALKKLSHMAENVLMPIRDGELTASPEVMDVLLGAVDKLRVMIDDIQASDDVPCEDELAQLEALLSNDDGESGDQSDDQAEAQQDTAPAVCDLSLTADFDSESEGVLDAVKCGKHVYRITVNLRDDLHARDITPDAFSEVILQVGEVLAIPPDIAQLEGHMEEDVSFSFIFASVLEEGLIPVGLELPPERVELLDVSAPATSDETETSEEAPASEEPLAPTPKRSKSPAKPKAPAAKSEGSETLRVKVDLLTSLMNTASELVLGRNQLLSALEKHRDQIPGLAAILQNVDHVTSELQEGVMQTRMQPVGTVFGRFSRVVRDMARKLGKKIDLQTEGAEVELDRSVIELLGDPLTHIVRNCADHALEGPDEREAAGKSKTGTIRLHAFHEGGQVNIAIIDDGRGIDAKKIAAKAIEKNVITEADAAKMSDKDIVKLVFAPGFSTAEQVTDVSGRGVGMDVVRTNIEKLGGHIDIETGVGEGTTVLLQLPLTLAIVPALVIGTGDLRFAVPQVNLVELVRIRVGDVDKRIESVHGADVLRLRGRLLPLVRLADVLGIDRTYNAPPPAEPDEKCDDRRDAICDRRSTPIDQPEYAGTDQTDNETNLTGRSDEDRRHDPRSDYNILVLQIGANRFGVIVDTLFDSEEIVVKPLSAFVKQCECFSGSTIMGDGRIIMILDVGGLAARANLHFGGIADEEKRRSDEQAARGANTGRRSIILFNVADEEPFAVPQEKVLRLERIKESDIEKIGGNEFIQYRGRGLPLIRLDQHLPVNAISGQSEELFLVIPKHRDEDGQVQARAGIVASRIADAMDVEVALQNSAPVGPGVQGAAIVGDRLTLFIDPVEFIDGVCEFTEEAA
jgi:two-component system, chemotaxis family, sensor kinase CheA